MDVEDHATVTISSCSLEEEEVQTLMLRQQSELLLHNPTLPPLPTANIPIFLIVRRKSGGQAIACGGLRPLQRTTAEIKRMYVVPEARGRSAGISALLINALERTAQRRGWTTLRLQTGASLHVANAFYQRHGYTSIPNYGDYMNDETTVSLEKSLVKPR